MTKKKATCHVVHVHPHIPAYVATEVWNGFFGKQVGCAPCPMCQTNELTQRSFECGHLISFAHGGITDATNLRPICGPCNKSVGAADLISDDKNHKLMLASSVYPILPSAATVPSASAIHANPAIPAVASDAVPPSRCCFCTT